jgi:hypothetical protein
MKKLLIKKPAPATDAKPAHKVRYENPIFAAKVKGMALRSYRAAKKGEFELTGNTVLRALKFVDEYAEKQSVLNTNTGKSAVLPIILPTVLAQLLDTSYQTIWRWSKETQQVPEPTLIDHSRGRDLPVYHVEEARIMVRVIGEHLNEFKYYRKDHAGTRDRLFHEIEQLRHANYGEKTNGTHQTQGDRKSSGVKALVRKR